MVIIYRQQWSINSRECKRAKRCLFLHYVMEKSCFAMALFATAWEVLGDKVPRSCFWTKGCPRKAQPEIGARLFGNLFVQRASRPSITRVDRVTSYLWSCPRWVHFPLFQGQVKGTCVKAGNPVTSPCARQMCQQRVRLELLGCLSGRCPWQGLPGCGVTPASTTPVPRVDSGFFL